MQHFLKEKIIHIFDQNPDDFSDISIIIPNKRAAVYIHKHLSEHLNKTIFSPKIQTISEWIDEHTGAYILSQTELLYILFDIHQHISEEAEDFESFSQLGKMMLSDFDEIDRYLLDPTEVYRNLKSIKEIENWSFDREELSKHQEAFQNVWDQLPIYYTELNERLDQMNATYQGQAYRQFYLNLDKFDFKRHYFLGFNALSKSEREIFNWFRKQQLGAVYFDMDAFYFENKEHEARHFYDQICNEWHIQAELYHHFNTTTKNIEVIETSQQIAQVKIAAQKIAEWKSAGIALSETAIVLADESLLIPLLESLPMEIEQANITMGYPLKFSHLNTLIELIFEIQFNYGKYKTDKIHYSVVLELLEHPYIKVIAKNTAEVKAIKEAIIQRNMIFISIKELEGEIEGLQDLTGLIARWKEKNYLKVLNSFSFFAKHLSEQFNELKESAIDLEIIYQFNEAILRFTKIYEAYSTQFKLSTFKQQLYQFWQSEELSFLGNPTNGLQVMGILETRTLDFSNLIILGMNEGVLPKTNIINSMIPRDLKAHCGLPLEEDRQAIFAHHFYRLLQRSNKVCMTYNSNAEDFGGGEVSRYITQLQNELDVSKGHTFSIHTFSPSDEDTNTATTRIKNTEEIRSALLDILTGRGLSPSAFNTLVRCPLDFYYQYVLGLREENEVEETIESSTFGTKIHDVLEAIIRDNFFKNEEAKPLAVAPLKAEKKKVEERLIQAYIGTEDQRGKRFKREDLEFGQNKLSLDVSKKFIERFIDLQIQEITNTPDAIMPVGLEIGQDKFFASFEVDIDGKSEHIKISGQADRIDKIGGVHRIIDYKSGKCDKNKLSVPHKGAEDRMHRLIEHDAKGYVRQLFMYALMFRSQYPHVQEFSAGIISMVNLRNWLQNVEPEEKNVSILSNKLLDEFQDEMLAKLEELFDLNYIFEHNPSSDYCEHCGV